MKIFYLLTYLLGLAVIWCASDAHVWKSALIGVVVAIFGVVGLATERIIDVIKNEFDRAK